MTGYKFDSNNLLFYSNDYQEYPEEIDICIIHNDWTEENKQKNRKRNIHFLDNYLGEIEFLNNIDNLEIVSEHDVEKELVPIARPIAFLKWRQKEFIEKYNGLRYYTENDSYSSLRPNNV